MVSGWLNWCGREDVAVLSLCRQDDDGGDDDDDNDDGRRWSTTTATSVDRLSANLSLYRTFKCNAIQLIFDAVNAYAFIHFRFAIIDRR